MSDKKETEPTKEEIEFTKEVQLAWRGIEEQIREAVDEARAQQLGGVMPPTRRNGVAIAVLQAHAATLEATLARSMKHTEATLARVVARLEGLTGALKGK